MYAFYADLYFLLNMAVDLILLHATGRVMGFSAPLRRLLAGALIGSLYALGSLFVALPAGAAAGLKLAFSVVMIGSAFGRRPFKAMAMAVFAIHLMSAAVAGVALLVDSLGYIPDPSRFRPPHADAPQPALWGTIAAALALLGAGAFTWRLVSARLRTSPCIVPVEVSVEGRSVRLPGLVDTGCTLSDPLSGAPALLAEADALDGLLPSDVLHAFSRGWDPLSSQDALLRLMELEPSWAARLRLLPCSTALGERGVVPAFTPDSIRIGGECRGVVGVVPGPLDGGGAYRALVNPRLLGAADSLSGAWRRTPGPGPEAACMISDERG